MLNRIKIRACWKEQRLCGDNIWEKQVLDWMVVRHIDLNLIRMPMLKLS